GAPANLALREDPWTDMDAEQPFPCLLPKDVKPRFSPVPIMLIGGPAVGKTSFLYALADYLNRDLGHVREGICVESSDLEELRYSMREKWRPGANPSTTRTEKYNLLVRDAQDPEVARWMRLRLTDYSGAELCQPSLTPELLKNLRAARALLFLVD